MMGRLQQNMEEEKRQQRKNMQVDLFFVVLCSLHINMLVGVCVFNGIISFMIGLLQN